ncbi:MAG: hypothetical protein K0R68_3312 [Mycobacterium sp.]|nr:hypothetical protein [Mycobacterium sp.]
MNIGGLVQFQALIHVVGDLGGELFVRRLGEHPGNVEGHVPGAQDCDLLGVQWPVPWHIGMPVVPGDEIGRAVATGQVDARDVEGTISAGAGGEDHRVVVAAQIGELDIGAVVHVADESDLVAREHAAQRFDDLLDAGMVRCDAVAHQTIRSGQPVEDVHRGGLVLLGQDVGGIDARRTCADDCDTDLPHTPSLLLGKPSLSRWGEVARSTSEIPVTTAVCV